MMSLSQIESVNRAATRVSQRERKVPSLIEPEDVQAYLAGDQRAIHIPFIGSRVPRGYRKVGEPYFVDSTGMGSETELAMTLRWFLTEVVSVRASYWGTVESGPFQVYVQRFEYVPSKAVRKAVQELFPS